MAASAALILGSVTAGGAALAAVAHASSTARRARTRWRRPGSHLYPDTGNGGYTSLHTAVDLVYDATSNQFLPGNHVTLTDRATQCLTSFSLDFERRSANRSAGPDMTVTAVRVNGQPACSTCRRSPTYPGRPARAERPGSAGARGVPGQPGRRRAAQPAAAGLLAGAAVHQPGPERIPERHPCPANKLVITPGQPIRDGRAFQVTVSYTGLPGCTTMGTAPPRAGSGSNKPTGDGGFVTTEPVGTEDWMPLNDYPSAKPTYDVNDTVNAGRTVLANGILLGQQSHPPNAEFPHGSVTWHWDSAAPVASYLVEDSVGGYRLTERTVHGIRFYQAQASSLSAARQARNRVIMNMQPDITQFESMFSGPFPFRSDGVAIGRPSASFEEEMQTMITFAGGTIDTDTLYHENMHQWWGDHVTEAGYTMTFYKEGLATLAEFLFAARTAQAKAGGPGTRAGRRAFQQSLVHGFDSTYASKDGFWTVAPSNPTPWALFGTPNTYLRPGISYIALRQILGHANFSRALRQIQRQYGGGSITEPQLEAAFARWLPNHSAACTSRLGQFFRQWFDTAYPKGGGANRPHITGPGLAGPGFYTGGCTRP